jgi:hypothetical protein
MKKIILLLLFISSNAFSIEKLSYDCAVSFDINPNKEVSILGQNVTCSDIDTMRIQAYDLFNKYDGDYRYISDNIQVALEEITRVEEKIKDHTYSEEHTNLALTTFSKYISVIGLASCMETAGAGCALAAISFGIDAWGQFKAATSYPKKARILSEYKERLKKAKSDISRHQKRLPKGYDAAVGDFNHLCEVIKKECVK